MTNDWQCIWLYTGDRLLLDLAAAPDPPGALPVVGTDATGSQVVGVTTESLGTVKMYKSDKGFGFVGQDAGGKDVFVHATALARAGLTTLTEGQRVRMQIGQGKKGLEAQTIELLD